MTNPETAALRSAYPTPIKKRIDIEHLKELFSDSLGCIELLAQTDALTGRVHSSRALFEVAWDELRAYSYEYYVQKVHHAIDMEAQAAEDEAERLEDLERGELEDMIADMQRGAGYVARQVPEELDGPGYYEGAAV